MLLTVAGERADMESIASQSKADSYMYFIIIILTKARSNIIDRLSPELFSRFHVSMKSDSEEEVGEELFFLTLGS